MVNNPWCFFSAFLSGWISDYFFCSINQPNFISFIRLFKKLKKLQILIYFIKIAKMWELSDNLLENLFIVYLYTLLKTALFLYFSHWIWGVLPRLVWSQKSSISPSIQEVGVYLAYLSGSVWLQGHTVVEALTGVARELLYIVGGISSLLWHPELRISLKWHSNH